MKPLSKAALPTRLIMGTVLVLCLGILASALFTYVTFLRLRNSYLSNRGHEIAAAIEVQARGPGRRNNPEFWQSLLESTYAQYSDTLAYVALVDGNGAVLAGKDFSSDRLDPNEVFTFDEPLMRPGNLRREAHQGIAGWRIRIGLLLSQTDFIKRQALLQLVVSSLAVVALFTLSLVLLRTINRFLELKMREGAEAQLRSLGVMAASLAHEIRNPLGAMKGLTQLAQEDLPPGHQAQPQLKTVVSEAERLERLVTDLLDFARAREPQISEFDLTELLLNIRIMLQSKLASAGVTLHLSAHPTPFLLKSDSAGLRQVLLNVLINALDASPAGGAVTLTASRDESHKAAVIQVDDSGKGLGGRSPDELFQPFITGKVRGTGLGLAVSRQIVESLGGKITLEELACGGARCTVKLPLL